MKTKTKIATLLKIFDTQTGMGATAKQALYKLSHPLKKHRYVMVSAAPTWDHGPETYIFPADKNGEITDYEELPGSFVGGLSHQTALEGAGYKIVIPASKSQK